MKNPFAFLTAVPNRAAFRQMGLRGRRGAQLVKQTTGLVAGVDERDDHRWIGVRKNKFTRPRLGRSLPWLSHQNAYVLKRIARQAGAINNHRWRLDRAAAAQKETQP
jgi:hypothetical protein